MVNSKSNFVFAGPIRTRKVSAQAVLRINSHGAYSSSSGCGCSFEYGQITCKKVNTKPGEFQSPIIRDIIIHSFIIIMDLHLYFSVKFHVE